MRSTRSAWARVRPRNGGDPAVVFLFVWNRFPVELVALGVALTL